MVNRKALFVVLLCLAACLLAWVVLKQKAGPTSPAADPARETANAPDSSKGPASPAGRDGGLAVRTLAPDASAMFRLVLPVRLPAVQGKELDAQVARTRALLQRFADGGFARAIWAVDKIPGEGTSDWAKACLKAFPRKPILALDCHLADGQSVPDGKAIEALLIAAGDGIHSVIVNFTALNNFENTDNQAEAIEAVRANIGSVRKIQPKAFIWLLLDDDPTSTARMPAWTAALGETVDGYYLHLSHGLRALSDQAMAAAAAPLFKTKKPVLRGGFAYTAPIPRPGIEQDLLEQYRDRMGRYEAWLVKSGYAGYGRVLGESVPGQITETLCYLPAHVAGQTKTKTGP